MATVHGWAAALLGAVLAVPVLTGPGLAPARAQVTANPVTIDGGPTSATDERPVALDADVYLPAVTPAPAVVIAHGFGGNKYAVVSQAQQFADRGFVVLAYTARGFAGSTGEISMNSPQFEVADARSVIDHAAGLSEVVQDSPDDPRIGFVGGSYGGALALLVAGYDDRVDAVAADITWNDLESSLFGQSSQPGDEAPRGVFKQWWAGGFFSVGLNQPGSAASPCGRFAPDWCAAFDEAAESGVVTRKSENLMARSSPASVTDRIRVPTLIGAGQADSLFPFAQAVANHDQIRAADPKNPVKLVWHGGGHDGGLDESERLTTLSADWMSTFLAGGPAINTDFEVTLADGALGADSRREPAILTDAEFPGLYGSAPTELALSGSTQAVRAPAGGAPAAISSFPGLGALAGQIGITPPGQAATFDSAVLNEDVTITGSPRIRVSLAATVPVRDVALFASMRIVSGSGTETTPQGLVAPVRLDQLGPVATEVTVDLPAIASRLSAGDRVQVVVATTDAAYRLPTESAIYDVQLTDPAVTLPVITGATVSSPPIPAWLWLAVPLILAIGVAVHLLRPRTPQPQRKPELAETPVAIEGLSKAFKGGVLAVDDVTFSVPPGIVLGLLGPNGAGKTTTMRMLMGLIRPTAGAMYVFGERITPGAPVLSRVGALVEGAGFLPHLTGRQNLDLYWRATGRSGEPGFDEVLEIAGLGHAVDRKVRSYSQGMRQRLGIAQAMLGNPDVLMLDEPTNGLDPPQIREMRDVLRDYAATGRTVIVSSHLLAEVEMTCTHVVVMHRGRLVAQGEVGDLKAEHGDERLEDVFLDIVGADRTVGGG